jgi:hypothetical protein
VKGCLVAKGNMVSRDRLTSIYARERGRGSITHNVAHQIEGLGVAVAPLGLSLQQIYNKIYLPLLLGDRIYVCM